MKCFYHNADLDGRCSGAIVKLVYPECELIGINYGDAFPWEVIEPCELVYMVDFCLQPFEDMIRLNETCDLIWIDHHKTSVEELSKSGMEFRGLQEIGKAGCELTWEYLQNAGLGDMPPAVFLLGRYDVWDHHNHPGSLEFQYGMRQFDAKPNHTEFWKSILYGNISNILDIGKQLLAYEERQNEMYVKSCAFEVELDGLRCIAVNKGLTSSLLFKSVYDPEKHDAMLSFCRKPDKWTVSIYATKPEVDASAICKARGGGGHKGAAGFQCQSLPFLN